MDGQQAQEILQSAEHGNPDAIYEPAIITRGKTDLSKMTVRRFTGQNGR